MARATYTSNILANAATKCVCVCVYDVREVRHDVFQKLCAEMKRERAHACYGIYDVLLLDVLRSCEKISHFAGKLFSFAAHANTLSPV